MAKKSSTVYLEEKFWNMITEYQNDNGLSSRNDALLLILKEWDILRKIDFSNISFNVTSGSSSAIISNEKVDGEVKSENKEETKIDPRITQGIFGIANSMKEE